MSTLTPEAKPEVNSEDLPFEFKCSATKPERALINGGLFVVTIPINKMGRFEIIGFAYDALHNLVTLLDMLDANKAKHKKPSLTDGVAEAVSGGLSKLAGVFSGK